ncbi:MAG TPA: acyl-CoA dehydrogenase family protein [Acidimicrobiales bacterium]
MTDVDADLEHRLPIDRDTGADEVARTVRSWIGDHLPVRWREAAELGGAAAIRQVRSREEYRAWYPVFGRSGMVVPTWPAEYGGLDVSPATARVIDRELSRYNLGRLNPLGLNLAAPALFAHGAEAQRLRFLPPIVRNAETWCQLFSEPGAGSDLAGLTTRAERDGGDWIVNGQKVWTSVAHCSDIGELLCRTDPGAPKHEGITAFLVDMDSPGVEVRPLRQMTGGAEFNEVFFTDVRIPDARRLGPVNGGWKVGITTLMNERATVGTDSTIAAGDSLNIEWLTSLLDSLGLREDPVARRRLAELYVRQSANGYLNAQSMRLLLSGRTPGPESSVAKLMNTHNVTDAAEFVAELLGPRMIADNGDSGTFAWSELLLSTPALRLLGGTDEIMKNILAERVLGLPKEPAQNAKPGRNR